jgi:hypothetical protein
LKASLSRDRLKQQQLAKLQRHVLDFDRRALSPKHSRKRNERRLATQRKQLVFWMLISAQLLAAVFVAQAVQFVLLRGL